MIEDFARDWEDDPELPAALDILETVKTWPAWKLRHVLDILAVLDAASDQA